MPPAQTMSPPTSVRRRSASPSPRATLRALRGAIGDAHQMALVAHHAADLQPAAAGVVGEVAGVARLAAAARQADVDVDQHVLRCPAAAAASIVSWESTATVITARSCNAAIARQPVRIERFVGQEQVVAEAGGRHADHLARCGAGERWWPAAHWAAASAVHLWALTCGRSRLPGGPAAIVARLWSSASASISSAGVDELCETFT